MTARLLLRLLVVLGLAAVSLVLFGAPAQACSCAMQEPAAQVSTADQVFTGTVVDSTRSGDESVGEIVYDVEVDRSFKGDVADTVQVATAASSATCGLEGIPTGDDYVFFTNSDAQGRDVVSANLCGGSAPLTKRLVKKVETAAGPGTTPPSADSGDSGDQPAHEAATKKAAADSEDDGVPVWPFIGGLLVIALAAGAWSARRTT